MANKNRDFLALQNAIKLEMQLDPGLISIDERKQFINDAIADLGDIPLFEKEIPLSVVNGSVSFPDDYVQPISVVSSDGRPLTPMSLNTVITTGGAPIGYIPTFNTMKLYPKPIDGTTITLYYNYKPQGLVLDTDQPDIPNGHDALLVDFAVAKCHRKNGNVALFREYMGYYETKKSALIDELIRRVNSRVVPMYNQDEVTPPINNDIIL